MTVFPAADTVFGGRSRRGACRFEGERVLRPLASRPCAPRGLISNQAPAAGRSSAQITSGGKGEAPCSLRSAAKSPILFFTLFGGETDAAVMTVHTGGRYVETSFPDRFATVAVVLGRENTADDDESAGGRGGEQKVGLPRGDHLDFKQIGRAHV